MGGTHFPAWEWGLIDYGSSWEGHSLEELLCSWEGHSFSGRLGQALLPGPADLRGATQGSQAPGHGLIPTSTNCLFLPWMLKQVV